MKWVFTKLGIVTGLLAIVAMSVATPTLARSKGVVTGRDGGYYAHGSASPYYSRGYYGGGDAWDQLRRRNASPSWAG